MFNALKNSLTLAGASAGLMYLFDPDLGRRRRSLLRDQLVHSVHRIGCAADVTLRDMQNRLFGTYSELQGMFAERDTSDQVVADRVRSKMGRYVSHPSAIEVKVHDGCLTLSGPILASEVQALVNTVETIPGVEEVDNRLEVHESADNISALQGGSCLPGEPSDWMQANWSPTARFVAGATGGMLIMNCLGKRTLPAMICGTAGAVLLARALSTQQTAPWRQRTGGAGGIGGGESSRSRTERQREREGPVPAGPNTPQDEMVGAAGLSPPSPGFRSHADELVDEASMESFPASDSPSFTRR